MTSPEGPATAEALAEDVDMLVLDAGSGGTGSGFDWARIPGGVAKHSLLAGGIGPANIREALCTGCAGDDLNSGVEYPETAGTWAGKKDAVALRNVFSIIASTHY